MSEMVERVARALCAEDGGDPEEAVDRQGMKRWQAYIDDARAAIEAMREPTDLMGNGLPPDYRPGSHSATQIWRALIDKALK